MDDHISLLVSALDQLPQAAMISDTAGTLVYVNTAFEQVCGCTRQDAIGKNISFFTADQCSDSEFQSVITQVSHGKRWRGDFLNSQRSNRCQSKTVEISPIRDKQGKITHCFILQQDTSSQKEYEVLLRKNEIDLARMQMLSHTGSWSLDASENLHLSAEAQNILGLERTPHTSLENCFSCVHPDDADRVKHKWDAALAGELYDLEYRIVHPNGDIRWIRDRAYLGFDSQGTMTEAAGTLQDVTDYRLTVDKLKASEANFHTFFQNNDDFLFIVDFQGKIIHANKKVPEGLGYDIGYIVGRSILDLHPESKQKEALDIMQKMIEGKATHCPLPLKASDGRWIPVETRVVNGEWDGAPVLFGISRDLTKLAASEEKFSKVFHLSPVPMVMTTVDSGTFVEVNEAFSEVTGYAAAEVLGKSSTDIGLYVDELERRDVIDKVRASGSARGCDLRIRAKDGSVLFGLFSVGILRLQDQQLFLTQMLDISERKQTESELEMQRSRLRSLLDSLPYLVCLKDPDGIYLACNPSFGAMFGADESEIIGKTDYDFLDSITAENFRKNDILAVQSGGPRVNEEVLNFSDTGYSGLFETTKTPIVNSDGQLLGVLSVSRDMTGQKQAEQQRLQIDRELQQSRKMEALGQLSGGVAHEFNNMLAVILGHADLLANKLERTQNHLLMRHIEHINRAGEHARDMVHQLLVFSRPRETKPRLIRLEPAIQDAIALVRNSLPSSISLECHTENNLPDVYLDTGELQQVILNLLLNARDALNGKGKILISAGIWRQSKSHCISCRLPVEGEWLEISVSDNGAGIPDSQLSRIFEPFYSSKPVGKGTGLGLSVVQGIVKHNGGHILVDSNAVSGTCFRLLFPPQWGTRVCETETIEKSDQTKTLQGTVLLVDDEPALLEVLSDMLKREGLDVIPISDSREALLVLTDLNQCLDLLITDQSMPEVRGTELVARAHKERPGLKTIVCSGYSENINHENYKAFGVDCYFLKPVSLKEMRTAVAELL